MPINNFEFPSVTFSASYQSAQSGSNANLGVCCVGSAYKLHRYADGTALKLDGLLSGSTHYDPNGGAGNNTLDLVNSEPRIVKAANLDLNSKTHRLIVKNGVWAYKTITSGFEYERDTYGAPTGWIKFSGGQDGRIRPVYVKPAQLDTAALDYERGVRVGDPIRLVAASGEAYTCTVQDIGKSVSTSYYFDRIRINKGDIPLDSTNDLAEIGIAAIELCVYADAEFGSADSTAAYTLASPGFLTLSSNIKFKLDVFAEVDRSAFNGTLKSGDLYFEFRERNTQDVNKRLGFNSAAAITEAIGTPCADNPLALACLFALNASGNRTVYCVPVGAENAKSYATAVEALDRYNDVYSIVPCTTDPAIINTVVAHCIKVSEGEESKIRRTCWYGIDAEPKPVIWSGQARFKKAIATTQSASKIVLNGAEYSVGGSTVDDRYEWTATDLIASVTISATVYSYSAGDSGTGYSAWKNGATIYYTADRNPEADDNAYESSTLEGTSATITAVTKDKVYTDEANPKLSSAFYAGSADTTTLTGINSLYLIGYKPKRAACFTLVTTDNKQPLQNLINLERYEVHVSGNVVSKSFSIASTDDVSTIYLSSNANTDDLVDNVDSEDDVVYGLDIVNVDPSGADQIASIVSMRQERSNTERAQCVWANKAIYNGEYISNTALAAAAAGMRSYEQPHRPLSNLGYSFFTISGEINFSLSDLLEIGSNGIWVIDNNNDGAPVNKRQITTAVANDLNKDEESVIANIDTIAMNLINTGQNIVGSSNINDLLISIVEMDIRNRLNGYLSVNNASSYVGPQLLDYQITDLSQDATTRDKIYATIELTPPHPFNKLVMKVNVI